MGKKLITASWLAIVSLAWPFAAHGQITSIYNSNGFEPPGILINSPPRLAGFGSLPGAPGAGSQQGWYTTDIRQLLGSQAGTIQSSIVQSGTQAFRVNGPTLFNDSTFSGGTFWWKYPDSPPFTGNVFNPVANGTPVVVAQTGFRREHSILLTDIPLQGLYFEGLRSISGNQYMITQVSVDPLGTIRAITVGGVAVASAAGVVPNATWVDLRVELDFANQNFQVFLNNSLVMFEGGSLTAIPFRDTNIGEGPFNRLREHGYNAFFNTAAGVTTGDAYFDNYNIFARGAAVPEPTTWALFGLVAGGVSFWRCRRRVQKELDDFEREHRNDPEVAEELNTP